MKNEQEYIDNINWEMLGRVLNANATEEEQKAFNNWLNESPSNYLLYKKLQKTGDININKMRFDKIDTELALKNVKQKIRKNADTKKESRKRKYFPFNNISKIAAAVALILSLGYFFFYKIKDIKPSTKELIVVSTSGDERKEIVLPDKTEVYLNSNSVLTYPKIFNANNRKVILEGEAFFDVFHNPSKPFIISANETVVKVLGTSFDLKAYKNSEDVEVIVSSGKVSFGKQLQRNELILKKGDLGKFSKKTNKFIKAKNENLNYLSWKTKSIEFNNTGLDEVVFTLEVVYMVDFKMTNESISDCKLTARYVEQTLDEILSSLEITFDLKIEKKGKVYIIYGKKC